MQHNSTLSRRLGRTLSCLLCFVLVSSMVLFQSGGVVRAATTWNAPASNTESNPLNGIRYGNGRWVAPGAYSHYATSTDGANWSDRTISGATTINDAFYAGQWVIAGSTGDMFSSPDGVTWTARTVTPSTSANLWSLYGDGGSTFVAVGDGGTIVTGNGTTFTAQTAGSNPFYGVTYGGGQFIAVGAAGTIYTSPDGTAWTRRTSGTSNDLYAVAYASNLYVAVGMAGTMLTSTNGVTWTSQTSGVSVDLNGVEHGPGKWVAVGGAGTIISSPDGISWTSETSGTSTNLMHVAQGNGLWVAVGDGGTIRTQVALSNNANLSNLTLSSGTLTPAFASGTTSYTASVPYTTTSLNVTPTVQDATATVKVNGTATASGSAATVPLSVGVNTITVAVTAQDGTPKTYTVTVSRAAPSTNANLSNLTISQGTLTPAFAAGTTAYTATVGNAVTSVNVTPTVADSTATVTVNGAAATSGSPKTVNLNVGINPINVVVMAQDGATQKTYTVTVTRVSNNANLSNLTLSSGTLSPVFSAGTTTYTASVPYAVSSVDVTPTVADSTAAVTVNGNAATSGSPANVTLSVGPNPINVVVTAQDGTTKTYTVTVTRAAASTNADLSNLTLSTGTLSPAFAPGTTSYTAYLPYGTSMLNITPTTADANATLTVNGSPIVSGNPVTAPVTTLTFGVTAEDGTTAKTYTLNMWVSPGFTGAATNTSQVLDVGASLTALQVNASPGVTLTFTLTGGALPAGITLNGDGTFSGTASATGTTSATIQVADNHGGTATTTLAVTVQQAPAFTGAAANTSQLVSAGAGLASLQVTKATGETVTFTLTGGSLPAGVTLNTNGTFSGTATTVGDTSATIQVTDTHGGAATTTLAVTVQVAPAFTAAAANTSQAVSQGTGLSPLSATAAAGETLTFTLTGGSLPTGTTLNTDGTFNGTASTPGTYTAAMHAADTHGGTATTTLTVTVKAPPAYTGDAANTSQLVSVGGSLVALSATWAPGETVTYALTGGALPDGITLNGDGTFSGATTTVGVTTATIRVMDTLGGEATTTLNVTVQVAPAFTPAAANTTQLISAGAGLAALDATAAGGETLTFTVTGGSLPDGITLTGNGTFSGTATTAASYTATVTAADTHGGTATTTLSVTVQPGPAFTAAAANSSQLVSVGAGLTALQATKATGETLTFTLTGGFLPTGITLNADGTFTGTVGTVGSTTATIKAADTHGGTATATLVVTVQAAPAFTGAPANTAQLVSVTGAPTALQATMATGETLNFSLSSGTLPAGISLNTDGTFSGTVTTAGEATTATIEAADTHGGKATTTLHVTTQQGPVFTADSQNTAQLVSVGAGLTALHATAAAGETLTFSLAGGALPNGISLNANGTFSGTATTEGSTIASVVVADTHGGHVTTALTVTVQAKPAYTADATNTVQLASVGAGLTALHVTAATGETLTFARTGGTLPAGITLNSDGTFSGTVTTVGTSSATITVTDTHGGLATTTLSVTVQAAPAFTAAATNTAQFISTSAGLAPMAATGATGETLTFTVTDGDVPAGINLNADGTFSGAATTEGATTATIQAADTHGGKATTTLTVTVQQGPAYTADATNTAQLVSVGAGLTALQATKAAGETLTFTLTGGTLPAGIALNAGGTFTGAVTTTGTTTATIQVADTHGGTATTTLAVTVQPAPAFTAADTNMSQQVSVGAGLTALAVTKATGETLTFTKTGGTLPDGISLNTDGTFSGTVTTVGSTTATIQVSDTHGGLATTTLTVTVQVAPAFTADAANTSQFISTSAGLAALQATSAAGETLTFSVVGGSLPNGISLNGNGTFSGTATATGSFSATVQAVDTHGGQATTTLAVTVQQGPAYTAAPTNISQLVSVGAGLTALAATKATGETLTFTLTGGALPAGISLNADGTFAGTVTTVSVSTATIHVADTHGGTADTTLAITVQQAPAFTAATTNTSQWISTSAGLTTLQATKAPGETLTFTMTGGALPDGISLNADGSFAGAATTVGDTIATIRVADQHGGVATTTLAVTVQQGPAFTGDTANTAQLISTGVGLAALTATKATGETLTFTVIGGSLPAGINLNGDGTFTGTATTVGTTTATIQAADTHGGTAATNLTVTVQPAPAFTADGTNTSQLVSVGAGLTALTATKATGETLTFTVTGGSLPAGLSLNADGTFSGTVTTVGSTTATIQAADTHGGLASTTLAVTVQVAPAFTADAANTSQFISTSAGLAALQATAATGETLTFTLTSGTLPTGITLNGDGTFSGMATTAGTFTATLQALDTHGGKASTSLTVTVQQGPAFTGTASNTAQLVSTGVGLAALQTTAAAGETLTFTITSGTLPAGITMSADGSFTGTATTVGVTAATIQVADTHGGTDSNTLTVTVQAAPEFTAATTNTVQVTSTGAGMVALETTAADDETLTFTLTGGALPSGITLNPDGTFAGTATAAGTGAVTIRVADTHGGQASTTLTFTVQQGPVFTAALSNRIQSIYRGQSLVPLQATADPGQTMTFHTVSGSLPDGVVLNTDGTFTGNPKAIGTSIATIEVLDARGGRAVTDLKVIVSDPPAPPEPPTLTVNGGMVDTVTPTITGSASLPDGSTVSVTVDSADYTAPVNQQVWSVAVTAPLSVGDHSITATGTNAAGLTGSATGIITVKVAPTVAPIANQTNKVGDRVSLTVSATGAPGSRFAYSAAGLPDRLGINPTTGAITGNVTRDGTYQVTITVTEQVAGGVSTRTFTWRVQKPGRGTLSGTVTDAVTAKPLTGVSVTLMWAGTDPAGAEGRTPDTAVTAADGTYAWAGLPPGDYYILARKDGYKAYDSREAGLFVGGADSNVRGGIIHIGETSLTYDFALTLDAAKHTRYVGGYPDGTFGPERSITRAEVASVLAHLLEAGAEAKAGKRFSDVSPDHWAAGAIARVAAAGLMQGDPSGQFRPDDPVSRAEVAVIIFRLLKLAPATASFSDVTGHWAAPYVGAINQAGIMLGYPGGTFQPDQQTTRAEFVTIVNRATKRGPLVDVPAPTFPDVPLDHWASGQVEEAATDHRFTVGEDGKEHLVPQQ